MIVSLPAQGAGYQSTPGDVTAWDVVTGKLRWVFHSIPHPGEFGYDTWPKDAYNTAGGVHNWSELTVDEANGIAFIPFGTARYDFFGGDRAGDNLYANSLVALDARTGKRLWHRQLVHHDLWDYDLPQAPKLLTIRRDGRPRRRRRASHEARLRVRVRPAQRRADLADRGARGAAVGRSGRAHVADAAVSDEAGAVRGAVVHRARHQSVLAGERARNPAAEAAHLAQRRIVHAAELRGLDRRCRATTAARTGRARPWIRSTASSTSCRRTCP